MAEEEEKRFKKPKKVSLAGKILGEGISVAGASLSEQWYNLASDEVERAMKQLGDVIKSLTELHDSIRTTDLKQKMAPEIQRIQEEWDKLAQIKETKQMELIMAGAKSVVELIAKYLRSIWTWIYDMLIFYLGPEKEMNIEKAKKRADLFVTILGDINLIAGIFDIIGTIEVFGTKLPFSAISRMVRNLSWTYGLGWLSWLTLSPTVQYGIVEWYDRFYKEYLKPEQPTRSVIQEMYRRKEIEKEEYEEHMGKLGYPQWLAEWYRIETMKQLSLSQLLELRQRELITDEEFDSYLRKLGYHSPEKEHIQKLRFKLATESTVKEAFKRRLILPEEYERLLKRYGYDGEDLELIKETSYDLLGKETLDELLARGEISPGEYIGRIKKLGYSDEDAELIIKTAYRTASKEAIRALMERGLLYEEEAREYLKKYGYDEEALELETKALTMGVEQSEMSSLISQAETEFSYGYLSEAELAEIYKYAGLPDNIIAIRLWRARLRLLDNINDQLKRYYIELYRKDKIDEAGLRDRLSGIIKSPELLESIIDYEIAHKMEKEEVDETLEIKDKIRKLQLKLDSLKKQLDYLITVRSQEERYYTAKLEILRMKYDTALEEQKPVIQKQIEQTEAKMTERLAYLDSKIEQVKNSIAAVEVDIEAAERVLAEEMTR